MSGRRVTRAATAAQTAANEILMNKPGESPPSADQANIQPLEKGKRLATTKAQGDSKRQKTNPGAAKPAKSTEPVKATKTAKASRPVKGGWDVLPHGMGLATGPINTATSAPIASDDNAAPSGSDTAMSPVTKSATADVPMTEGTDVPVADNETLPQETVAEATVKPGDVKSTVVKPRGPRAPRRQTRISAQKVDSNDSGAESDKPMIDVRKKVKRGVDNKYGLTRGATPYPFRFVPTPAHCEEVHRILTEAHGEVKQPEKAPAPSLDVAGCGEVPSVLDALLRTLISGNTLMANADEAIRRLVEEYGTISEGIGAGSINWNAVRLSPMARVVQTIRPAGCPQTKSKHIKTILDIVYEEQKARAHAHLEKQAVPGAENEDEGQKAAEVQKVIEEDLSLDHMHAMTADEAMAEFLRYPGIGVKTAACVILFCLRIPCFAVDTHVHKFCKWLGWVPEKCNELDTFNHGELMVPDPLKYGLHQLFIRHGRLCFKCRKVTKPGSKAWEEAGDCPLEHLLDRSKGNTGKVENVAEAQVAQDDGADGGEAGSKTKKIGRRAKVAKKAKAVKKEESGDESAQHGEDSNKDDDVQDGKIQLGKKGRPVKVVTKSRKARNQKKAAAAAVEVETKDNSAAATIDADDSSSLSSYDTAIEADDDHNRPSGVEVVLRSGRAREDGIDKGRTEHSLGDKALRDESKMRRSLRSRAGR